MVTVNDQKRVMGARRLLKGTLISMDEDYTPAQLAARSKCSNHEKVVVARAGYVPGQATLALATFNARTLLADGDHSYRVEELVAFCIAHRVSILGVQEHRRTVPVGTVRTDRLAGGWRLYFAGSGTPGQGGVGPFCVRRWRLPASARFSF
eukprot:jgi/Mesvir1/10295/Mv19965-RA.1